MDLTRPEMEVLALEDLLYHVDPGRRWDAVREFVHRCPRKVLEDILWGDSTIFLYGPRPAVHGELMATFESRAMLLKGSAVPIGKHVQVVYLAPSLEQMPEGYILGVVAREIAHAILRHRSPDGKPKWTTDEPNANALACEWGFDEEIEMMLAHPEDSG
jgi:hypothetical protein